jgi:hypothetical protein
MKNKVFDTLKAERLWISNHNGPTEIVKTTQIGFFAGVHPELYKKGWEDNINCQINRIPVMAPISAPILGVYFFGGIFPSKMERFAPFLATIQALSKTRVFLYT